MYSYIKELIKQKNLKTEKKTVDKMIHPYPDIKKKKKTYPAENLLRG